MTFYALEEPTSTQVLVVVCDRGGEGDAVFSTQNFDFSGRVSCKAKVTKNTHEIFKFYS